MNRDNLIVLFLALRERLDDGLTPEINNLIDLAIQYGGRLHVDVKDINKLYNCTIKEIDEMIKRGEIK